MCKGSIVFPLTAQIVDTIECHGLAWATRYYYARLPRNEARFFITVAHCYLRSR